MQPIRNRTSNRNSTTSRIVLVFTTFFAIAILIFVVLSSLSAISAVKDTVGSFTGMVVASHIKAMIHPFADITRSLDRAHKLGIWNDTTDALQFAKVIAPVLGGKEELLAIYSARVENGHVVKFGSETADSFLIQERAYHSNETLQMRRDCSILRNTSFSTCNFGEWKNIPYDPKKRDWFQQGLKYDIHSLNVDKQFGLLGPELQTSDAQGNIKEPVFSLVTYLSSPNVVIRLKFLSRSLSHALTAIALGDKDEELLIVNKLTSEVVALSSGVGEVDEIFASDNQEMRKFKILSDFISINIPDEMLEEGGVIGDSPMKRYWIGRIGPEYDNLRIVAEVDANDYMPGFFTRAIISMIFASMSLLIAFGRALYQMITTARARKVSPHTAYTP